MLFVLNLIERINYKTVRTIFLSLLVLILLSASCRKPTPVPAEDKKVNIQAGTYATSDSIYLSEPLMYAYNSGVTTDQQGSMNVLER